MIKEAIEYLTNLGEAKILTVNDLPYSTKNLSAIKFPAPATLSLTTLTGLVDYIRSGIDRDFQTNALLVHVESPDKISVYSSLEIDATRDRYISVQAQLPQILFDRFIPVEQFNIMLQACFAQNHERAKVLAITGNIKDENVQTVGDDGVSQSVTAKAGIATVANVVVPNPVLLAPYRMFTEVEQVESEFVLRMRTGDKGIEAALFEADGGAWRVEAARLVKEYLSHELKDCSSSVYILS